MNYKQKYIDLLFETNFSHACWTNQSMFNRVKCPGYINSGNSIGQCVHAEHYEDHTDWYSPHRYRPKEEECKQAIIKTIETE